MNFEIFRVACTLNSFDRQEFQIIADRKYEKMKDLLLFFNKFATFLFSKTKQLECESKFTLS